MGVEGRQYEGIKCLTCKEKDKKKREKNILALYQSLYVSHFIQNSHECLNI